MPGPLRQTSSSASLPIIVEVEEGQLESRNAPAATWWDTSRAVGRITIEVACASSAHFAVGFVVGKAALMSFGTVINHRHEPAFVVQTGFAVGTLAAGYGAVLGAGLARGSVSVRDMVASLMSIVVAGALFPVGALLGGSLAAGYTDLFASEGGDTSEMPAPPLSGLGAVALGPPAPPAAHPSFGLGAEKGACLLAMAGYVLCRWALQSPEPKDKIESLPTKMTRGAMPARAQAGVGRRRSE